MKPLESVQRIAVKQNLPYVFYLSIFLILSVLLGLHGLKATLREGQIHIVTLIWLSLMGAYFYEQLPIKPGLRRFIISGIFTFWFFEVHDLFWFIGTIWLGVRIGLPTIYPPFDWYFTATWKYVALLCSSWLFIREYLKPAKIFYWLFWFQVLCHAIVIIWQYMAGDLPYTYFIIQMLYDTLPYFFIVRRNFA